MKKIVIIAALSMLSGVVFAAERNPGGLSGEVEMGIASTRGNTDTQNINAKATVINEINDWKHTGKLEVLNNSDDGTTTSERYYLSAKTAHKIDKRNYEFGLLTYDADRFSGYDYRTGISVGYGHSLIKTSLHSLDVEGGLGYRKSKLSDSGKLQDEAFLRGAAIFAWNLSENATFSEDFSVEAGEDSTITKSVTSLKTSVTGNIATKITYAVEKTTNVPPDVKETDMEFTVNLVYNY